MVSVEKHAGLGDNVVPESYDITIEPNLKTFVFSGSETISVAIKKTTNRITLNSKEIKIKSAAVVSAGKRQQARVSYSKRSEEAVLRFGKGISGRAKLEMEFEGKHNDVMYGFYRSKYLLNGKYEYMASTQFEAPDARAAFPCFDEPSYKATFRLTLVVDKGLDALSNMPVESKRQSGNKEAVTFTTTPKMSSYLLFMGVGRFEYVSMKSNGTLIRAVTTPGKGGQARLALQYTAKFVDFYERYFGIRYPLPKLDIIAIPDFSAGAMENWGAITFREIAMLGDEKSAIGVKRSIAITVAHELAHQWFGDLVTMWWWNDLWLNESFATYMSYKAIDAVFPKWKISIEYITDVVTSALAADSLKSTHPVSVRVNTPQNIDEIFDAISYDKGGTILMMLEDYVGPAAFRKGLHEYLKAHSYSNATKYDLWGAIDAASMDQHASTGVARIASQWLNEKGYPIISAKAASPGTIDLSQKRFTLQRDISMKRPRLVPIHFIEGAGREGKALMSGSRMKLKVQGDWAKLNLGQRGLYRVSYSEGMLAELGSQVKSGKIKLLDSWGIVNDLFALARSSRISAERFISFVEEYCGRSDYPLDKDIFSWLSWLYAITRGTPLRGRVTALMLLHGKRAIEKTTMAPRNGEDISITELRSYALSVLGTAGDGGTVSAARKLLAAQLKTGKKMDGNIRPSIYRIVAEHGGASDYDRFATMRKGDVPPDEDNYLLSAIASFNDKALVKKALSYALTDKVRLQDAYLIPNVAASTDAGSSLIWPWAKENWALIMEKIPPSTHLLERFVSPLSAVSDRKSMEEIAVFFSSKKNRRGDILREYAHTMERIKANVRFREFNGIGTK